ncbi:hypothetical protein J3R30DRAFT_3737410 [Lentinula aciculospora]|uniref:Uncharacterized protein n=1 Tax=Lentinula aciculospora TaxID=153920 RepID=A0A9W9DJ09_9AGAR|nr:hypothetical protein J3R30DRAFT_3737410 [Lentinula aciculospora]
MSAHSARSLAREYENNIKKTTTDARLKALRDKAILLLEQRKRKQMEEEGPAKGHIINVITSLREFLSGLDEPSDQQMKYRESASPSSSSSGTAKNTDNPTPRYIVQSSSMTAFSYPRIKGILENPTVSCLVGSMPIVPEGFKFGTLAFYEPSQVIANLTDSDGNSEDHRLIPALEIRDISELSQHIAQASPHHNGEFINGDSDALKDMAETAHSVDMLRSSSGDDVVSLATTYLSLNDVTGAEGSEQGDSDDLS